MKDVFSARCISQFGTLLRDLADSLDESVKRDDVREWCERARTRSETECIEAWNAAVTTQLARQHAKYVRAISSITNDQAVVYHAIRYKDAAAVDACGGGPLAPIKMVSLVREMSESDATLLWRYVAEMSDLCYKWRQTSLPAVPTTAQIGEDIERRRAQRDAPDGGRRGAAAPPPASSVRGLTQGVDELWSQLCAKRGVAVVLTDPIRERIRACVRGDAEIRGTGLVASLPELGNDPYTPEQISVVERMQNLVTMDDSIPSDMMRGIEAVASRLVEDINSGRADLASLDLESIGQKVISGVSDSDMNSFASNLDKIIPALQRAHQAPP